jgi:putative peptide zinc metalloprotease protein
MLLTSVSTILVNANPLMRYDGYFILSDFLEIPNLAQLSRELLRHYLVKGCLGIELPLGKRMPQRRRTWLTIYAFAAGVYRWLMVFGALWFVSGALEHYDLQVLGRIAALFGLMALVIMPIWQTFQLLYIPGRISQMKTRRILLVGGTLAAVLGVVLVVPMPRTIDCAAVIGVRDADTIYAPLPGKLTQVGVAYGDPVEPGNVIATLSNDNLELAIAELTGQVEELNAQLKGLNKERLVSSEAGRAIESVQETLAMAEQQLTERIKDRESLVRTASRAGVVLPSPNALSRRKMATTLAKAHGDPLEPHNLGMHLQAGEILCQIGDPHELELLILIDQSMREYVQVGAKVEARPANSPYEILTSTITELSAAETHRVPPSLGNRHGGSVATQLSATEGEQLVNATYQARAPLDVESITLMPGLRCQVQIEAPPQTWGSRIWRWVEETFRFRT